MALKQNSAEGGANGATITTANSGGSSGDAFVQVTVAGVPTYNFSNNAAAHGSLSYRITGVSGDTAKIYLGSTASSQGTMRGYVYFNILPSAPQALFNIQNSSFGGMAAVNISSVNKMTVSDASGTTLFTSASALSAATWYRIELQVITGASTTTGTVNFQYYVGDSTTPLGTLSNTTANTTTINALRGQFGKQTSGVALDANFDDFAYDDTSSTPIGPYSATNAVPTCDAGLDLSDLEPYTSVTLSGTDADSDGTIVTRTWRQISGPTVTLTGNGATRSYIAPGTLAGMSLIFGYKVIDDSGASSAESTVTHSVLSSTDRAVVGGAEVPMQVKPIISTVARFEQTWTAKSSQLVRRGSEAATPDSFVIGTTKPKLVDPDNPTSTDNVGAAFGWNGVTLSVMNGDQTIPANTTWTNKLIHGYVTFTDETSRLINSVVDGRMPGSPNTKQGFLLGNNGGYAERCTIRATANSTSNYMNGLYTTGTTGNWTLLRCDISRMVDSIHVGGVGGVTALGCRMHDYSFYDDDSTHSGDGAHPYWSHGDVGIQRLSGNANTDHIEGCSIQGFFDVTGVTWSGGSWGSGTASGGSIGMPSTALNGGYPDRNYSNVITYSNVQPYTGMAFVNNWINGGSYPSGLIQMTIAGNHSFRLEGNRFALGGKAGGGSNKIFLATYASTSTVDLGSNSNIFDSTIDTPQALWGQPLTFTASGASIIPGNYA
jgi:hypothetical protein